MHQGLRPADENGGTGTRRQRIQDFRQRQPISRTENSADLAHYFPENGGDYPPLSQKWGDASPRPPCGGAPGMHLLLCMAFTKTSILRDLEKADPTSTQE